MEKDTRGVNEEMYNKYFGIDTKTPEFIPQANVKHINNAIVKDKGRWHTTETTPGIDTFDIPVLRRMADENMDSLEQLAFVLKKLCNAAWGEGWGEFSPDLKKGEDNTTLILPQITIETNLREIDENLNGPKPKLTDVVNEVDGEGNETGDVFLIYRQWYACNVEFNFYGNTTKEARDLMHRFEKLIHVYTGYLKRHGVQEIWFENESHPKCSLNYDESSFMRCIYYYIRFEAIMPVRQSVVNRINTDIGVNVLNTERVKSLIEHDRQDLVEFEFFSGDNGITYNED